MPRSRPRDRHVTISNDHCLRGRFQKREGWPKPSLSPRIAARGLEVQLKRELTETTLIIRSAVVPNTALGAINRDRNAVTGFSDVIVAFLQVQVVVVEDIEPFRTELEIDLLVDRNSLTDRRVKGPLSWAPEGVARNHICRIWTPIGGTQQVIGIGERSGG